MKFTCQILEIETGSDILKIMFKTCNYLLGICLGMQILSYGI